jgi:hypothetical protein
MDVIMPSIALILAMRDQNFDELIKAMVFLKTPTLNLVIKLAG